MAILALLLVFLATAVLHQLIGPAGPMQADKRSLTTFLARASRNWFPLLLFATVCLAISGDLLPAFDTPKLFRDDGDNFSSGWHVGIVFSPTLWSAAALSLMLVALFSHAYIIETGHHRLLGASTDGLVLRGHLSYVLLHGAPLSLMVLVAQAFFEGDIGVFVEVLIATAGLTVGFALGALTIWLVYWAAAFTPAWWQSFVLSVGKHLRFRGAAAVGWKIDAAMIAFGSLQLAILLLITVWRIVLTPVAIVTLFCWIALSYYLLCMLRSAWRAPVVLAFLALVAIANGVPLKHRFADLEDLYVAQPASPPSPTLVTPVASLDAWRAHLQANGFPRDRPPVVVLALSGGGYRASFWSAIVLDHLLEVSADPSSPLRGLMDHVRFVTGASGGMVAGAYFVTKRTASVAAPPYVLRSLREDTWLARGNDPDYSTWHPLERDSLSPVYQHVVQRDVFKLVIPLAHVFIPTDRGEVLERQWVSLSPPLHDLVGGETAGWRPSMILSPTLSETGEPLLISNLALPATLMGRELAEIAPAAHARLRVATAVRMNAAFPYITPAVEVPGIARSATVDAGFYDFYGVQSLAGLLSDPEVMSWVLAASSGVIVVRVDALHAPRRSSDWLRERIERAAESATMPLTATISALEKSARLRNDLLLRQLNRAYSEAACLPSSGPCRDDWVSVVDFENRATEDNVGISWYSSKKGLQAMQAEIHSGHNQSATAELITLWQHLSAL